MLREFLGRLTWSIVYDPAQQAGKKRQAKGLDKLENESEDTPKGNDFRELAWIKLSETWPDFCTESEDEV